MKTFATTLLLLASATAAYGHSAKAAKSVTRNLSNHKTSMSYHLFRPRLAKTAKTKSEKEVVLFSASAKSEKDAVFASASVASGKSGKSGRRELGKSTSAISARSSKAFGRALAKSSKAQSGRALIDGSLSLDLAPRTYPKSGKASGKATVFVIDAKSSKAVPTKVTRSIDPVQVSNDQVEPMKALSFIEYSSQTPVASKEETSGASALDTAMVGTLLAVSAFVLNQMS